MVESIRTGNTVILILSIRFRNINVKYCEYLFYKNTRMEY
jgi:hypothetical protein